MTKILKTVGSSFDQLGGPVECAPFWQHGVLGVFEEGDEASGCWGARSASHGAIAAFRAAVDVLNDMVLRNT